MAQLRVFVSSTAYDLAALRSSLRRFIEAHGFEPVLSEYSDVLYDPREHTHRSCLAEVKSCDIVILIIGSRFGSELTNDEASELAKKIDPSLLGETHGPRLSITQGETITAVDDGIPVFAFIESDVNHDYRIFQHNKEKSFASEIEYASISNPGTAEHIFSFIEFLKARPKDNALIVFDKVDDIFTHLEKQWAALFQRLLSEARTQKDEAIRIERLTDQFEELKTALLSTVGLERRHVIRAAVRFRRLVAFLMGIPNSGTPMKEIVVRGELSWSELLNDAAGITAAEPISGDYPPWHSILRRGSTEPYLCQLDVARIEKLSAEWPDFMKMDSAAREVVYDELVETMQPSEIVIMSPASSESRTYGYLEGAANRIPIRSREREAPIAGIKESSKTAASGIVAPDDTRVAAPDEIVPSDEDGDR
jgi:hypothetical protein